MSAALDQITPLLITYNEQVNLERSLAALSWARRIVVVDSYSTDASLAILARHATVQIVQRAFVSFADQCNFGLSLIETPWCLSLDADHLVPPEFVAELQRMLPSLSCDVVGVLTPFRYLVHGRPLRGSLLPPRFNLVRPGGGFYASDGHAHRFIPHGNTSVMQVPILHDDRKPLSRWLASQQHYLRQEVEKLLSTPVSDLSLADRLRLRHLIAPPAVFLLCLVWHRGLLDGWRGWYYAFQRLAAELLLSLMLWERRHAG